MSALREVLDSFFKARPELGSVHFHNLRDVVISSSVDSQEFETKIVQPLNSELAGELAKREVQLPQEPGDWPSWIARNAVHGSGHTLESAFIDLRTREFGLTLEQWRRRATELRSRLQVVAARQNLPWDEILTASRKLGRDPPEMRRWGISKGLSPETGRRISEYGRLLTLADYLPPQSAAPDDGFFARAAGARNLLLTDVAGVGVLNRMEQDLWLARGAPIEELSHVHQSGTDRIGAVHREIEGILGRSAGWDSAAAIPRVALGGDEMAWALRDPSPEQLEGIQQRIRRLRNVHYQLATVREPRDRDALSRALREAGGGPAKMQSRHPADFPSCVRGKMNSRLPASP